MSDSPISEIGKIIRDVTYYFVFRIKDKPFLETIIKNLRFQKIDDWNTLCSLMDVIGDTELAKQNFRKFGLSGPTKIFELGEQYLRLYGILNAIYMQSNAIIQFVELTKLKDKKIIKTKFDELKL